MQFKKKVIYSALISSGVLLASIFLRITPCRIAPAVPNPVYRWAICTLNPDQVKGLNSIKEYFGYTTSLSEAYFLILVITFIISMAILHFSARRKNN